MQTTQQMVQDLAAIFQSCDKLEESLKKRQQRPAAPAFKWPAKLKPSLYAEKPQPPIAEPPKSPGIEESEAALPPPVLPTAGHRGRAGEGASANGAVSPSPLPNPPPDYRRREQGALHKDTNLQAEEIHPCESDVAGKLSPRQLIAVDLLVSGKGDREVAEAVGVTRVTVTRWRLYHLAFRAAVSRQRRQTFGVASDRLRNLLAKAIDVLEKQMASEDPKQQMAAIRLMISLSKQCQLQPPDEPESSREILEREAQQHRRTRLAKEEADRPPDADDIDDALGLMRQRFWACQFQEEQPPGAIQKDTNDDGVELGGPADDGTPGTAASSPAPSPLSQDACNAGGDAGVPGGIAHNERINTDSKCDPADRLTLTAATTGKDFPVETWPAGSAI